MPMREHSVHIKKAQAVAMAVLIAAAMLFMSACDRKPTLSHAQYHNLPPSGWQRMMPLTIEPEYDDSTRRYDLSLAVRHDNSYKFSNLSLVVDLIAADSTMDRRTVEMTLADEYGNWTGGGFGAMYQYEMTVARGVNPSDVRLVVIWQAMQGCDTLRGLTEIGLFTRPVQ